MQPESIPDDILARIPEHQRTVFLPQLLQFDAQIVPTRHGLLARAEGPEASGWIWALSLDENRLFSVVRMGIRREFPLHEMPERDYWCIGLLCESSMKMMEQIWASDRPTGKTLEAGSLPGTGPVFAYEREQLAAFKIEAGDYRFNLAENTVHSSAHLHLFAGYFDHLEQDRPGELPRLRELLEAKGERPDTPELRRLARQITPRHANDQAAMLFYRGLADQLVAVFHAAAEAPAGARPNPRDDAALAEEACELIEASIAHPMDIAHLAQALHCSRTRLCGAFKRETGATIGEYQTHLRIRRAKELLEHTDAAIADIAQAVGYRHASTFTAAFKQATGTTPARYRSGKRCSC